jgi:hypothetical protein
MSSTYSTNLALELIGTGEQAGNWGSTTNTNLGTLLEQAISGYVTQAVSTGTDTTITIPNGATGVARNMFIELTGTGGTSTNLIVPSNKKLYFIYNNTTGAVTVKVSGQTGVSVPAAAKIVLTSNGTDIVVATNYMASATLPSATLSSPTMTGTPVAPTATANTNTTQVATTAFVQTAVTSSLQTVYPVGSIYMSTGNTNPNTLFGFGTWVAFGAGQVLIGNGGGYSAGATGGSADAIVVSHTHTGSTSTASLTGGVYGISQSFGDPVGSPNGYTTGIFTKVNGIPTANTPISADTNDCGGFTIDASHSHTLSLNSAGSSGTGANLQPYIVVYMWNRTA